MPEQMFELACEGINRSGRRKSGLALRLARIARSRSAEPAHQADRLAEVQALLPEAVRAKQA